MRMPLERSARHGARLRPKLTAPALAVLALGAVASAACRRAPEPADESARGAAVAETVKVMTFNVRYDNPGDGPDAWPSRRDAVAAMLSAQAPDLVGLQEALRRQLDDLARRTDGWAEIGVGRDDGREAGEYAAILYRPDRFEVIDAGTFWLSDTPDEPGSVSWGNRITRICTWAHLRLRRSGRGLWFYNVHLDHESQPSRERSVDALLARIAARGDTDPVIVTGDFNAGERNPAVAAMVAAGFRDSWRARHPDVRAAGTFSAFRGDSTGEKIDYVWVQPVSRVLDAAILRQRPGGRDLSDHFAVTALVRPHEGLMVPAPPRRR